MFDELEHVLFFLTDVIYRAIPALYESLTDALVDWPTGTRLPNDADLPTIVSFASWIGGDIERRPETTGRTIRETLERQRSLILDLYFNECRRDFPQKLSQSTSRDARVGRRCSTGYGDYTAQIPERCRLTSRSATAKCRTARS